MCVCTNALYIDMCELCNILKVTHISILFVPFFINILCGHVSILLLFVSHGFV